MIEERGLNAQIQAHVDVLVFETSSLLLKHKISGAIAASAKINNNFPNSANPSMWFGIIKNAKIGGYRYVALS